MKFAQRLRKYELTSNYLKKITSNLPDVMIHGYNVGAMWVLGMGSGMEKLMGFIWVSGGFPTKVNIISIEQ